MQGNKGAFTISQILELLLGLCQIKFIAMYAGDDLVAGQIHAGIFGSQPGLFPQAVQVRRYGLFGGYGTLIADCKAAGIVALQNFVIQGIRVNFNAGVAPEKGYRLAGGAFVIVRYVRGCALNGIAAVPIELSELLGVAVSDGPDGGFVQAQVGQQRHGAGAVQIRPAKGIGGFYGRSGIQLCMGFLRRDEQGIGGVADIQLFQHGARLRKPDLHSLLRKLLAKGGLQGLLCFSFCQTADFHAADGHIGDDLPIVWVHNTGNGRNAQGTGQGHSGSNGSANAQLFPEAACFWRHFLFADLRLFGHWSIPGGLCFLGLRFLQQCIQGAQKGLVVLFKNMGFFLHGKSSCRFHKLP